jgi:hypothetical protein
LESEIAPIDTVTSSAAESPIDKKTLKQSFRKTLSRSLGRAGGKSIRSIVGIYGSMKDALTRDERERRPNVLEITMAETTSYLNGFSKMSAFRRDYNEILLRELNDVQAKYATETDTAAGRTKCRDEQVRSDPPGGGGQAADDAEGMLSADDSVLMNR